MAKDETPLPQATAETVADYATAAPIARAEDESLALWRKEAAYFNEVKAALWRDAEYRNMYVAIHNREIVDRDSDKFRLARRMYEQFPGEVFFVGQVCLSPRVVHLRSPRVVG